MKNKLKEIKIDKEDQENFEGLMSNTDEVNQIISDSTRIVNALQNRIDAQRKTFWIEMVEKYKLDKNKEHHYNKLTKKIMEYDIDDFIPDKTEKESKFKEELGQMERVLSLMDKMTKKADELNKKKEVKK